MIEGDVRRGGTKKIKAAQEIVTAFMHGVAPQTTQPIKSSEQFAKSLHDKPFVPQKMKPETAFTPFIYTNDVYRSVEPNRDPIGATMRIRGKSKDVFNRPRHNLAMHMGGS